MDNIKDNIMRRDIITQSHENLFRFNNQVLHAKRKLKQHYLDQLEKAKKEYLEEAEQLDKKNLNQSFEKIEFFTPNIENQILATKDNTDYLIKILSNKTSLINESINGLVSIFKCIDRAPGFKIGKLTLPDFINSDAGSVWKLLLVIDRRIVYALQACEIELIARSGNTRHEESTVKLMEDTVYVHHGEPQITISYLKVLLAQKVRRDTKKRHYARKSQIGTAIRNPLEADLIGVPVTKMSSRIVKFHSTDRGSSKLIPEEKPKVVKAEETKKIEPVQLPTQDPYPVRAGHNFLIETSYEEKNSSDSGEELIGYQHTRDTIEDKIDMAIKRYNEIQEALSKVDSGKAKRTENQIMDEMRKRCKEQRLKTTRALSYQSSKNKVHMKLSEAVSKIHIVNLLGNNFTKW